MEVDIVFARIDPETGKLILPGSHKQPAFSLWEVSSVWAPLVLFDQRRTLASREKIRTFGIDERQRLVQAEGDFTDLGMQLRHDAPVPNFELAFRNNY